MAAASTSRVFAHMPSRTSRSGPESGLVGLIEPPIAVPPDGDESHVAEHGQVLGHRPEGDVKAGCDFTGSHLLIPDHGEDLSPPRLGDDLKGIHRCILDQIEIGELTRYSDD